VARANRAGIVFGYFFGPRHAQVPTAEQTWGLVPDNAIDVEMFGGLGLLSGDWPVIRHDSAFRRDDWPMPDFGRVPPFGKAERISYCEDTLEEASAVPVESEEAFKLPPDRLAGYGAVEIRLTKLLARKDS
jgi:hypothetical protein